jgi:uridine monophosphate synthetase
MTALQGKKGQLADLLFELGAIKFDPVGFRLKLHETQPDAPLSPIYLELRDATHPKKPGPLTPEAMGLIGDLMWELPMRYFRRYADIPEAGDPFGDQMERHVLRRAHPAERVRLHKEVRPDGSRRITEQVDGDYEDGDVCLLVDDLITQADTKLEAVKALESAGMYVDEVIVLVDRQQGGARQLRGNGYDLRAVYLLEELLAYYVSRDYIDQAMADKVMGYIADNQVA